MVERICQKQRARLLVLFPSQPKLYGADTNQLAQIAKASSEKWSIINLTAAL